MNSKTQFTTKGGQSTDVQTIKDAYGKSEQALFDLRYQLGIFSIYCEENKLKVTEQAEKLAKLTGLKASTIVNYCSQGKKMVNAKATFKDLQRFNTKAKKDGLKTGIENFARHCGGTKLATVAKEAPAKDAPATVRTHDTHTVGKDDATRCIVTHPLVMTATAKANLREAIEKACAASDITLESVFPELATKVNA